MKTFTPAVAPVPRPLALTRARMADYLELTKPRIGLLALFAVAAGFFMACGESIDFVLLLHTLVGTALVAAGSGTLNQVLEREIDARMRRTEHRPLPAGRLAVREALAFGVGTGSIGVLYLTAVVNPLTGCVAAACLAIYVFVYTPMKRWTSLNTVIGAIPGALPPVMGWTAARNGLGMEAAALFLILFLWQFPHFLAIAWIYREDYAHAGLKMLSAPGLPAGVTGRQTATYCLALVPASLVPAVVGLAGRLYFVGAFALGLGFLACALAFCRRETDAGARRVLRASILYLPALLGLMLIDPATHVLIIPVH